MLTENLPFQEALKRLDDNMPETQALSAEDIIDIHDAMIDAYGGSFGIRDEGLFESVVYAPFQNMFGEDLFPTVFDKAAKYLFDFSNYQVFFDGNKRAGLATCSEFLRINGFKLTISAEQAYILVMDIANHKYNNSSEIVDVLKNNVQFLSKDATSLLEATVFPKPAQPKLEDAPLNTLTTPNDKYKENTGLTR